MLVATTAAAAAYAGPPVDGEGAIRMPAGGYLYTPDAPAFTDLVDDLTVEAWVWLDDFPGDNMLWPIVIKPGSYGMAVLGPRPEDDRSRVSFRYDMLGPDGFWRGVLRRLPRFGGPPTQSWLHVAYQMRELTSPMAYLDGVDPFQLPPPLPNDPMIDPMDKSGTAIYVAGGDPNVVKWWDGVDLTVESLNAWIDEVRISKGWRYGGPGARQPRQDEGVDGDTIALWTFDDSPPYEDVSGNGHTLFMGGSLGVTARGLLTTTWAQLKRQ